MARALAFVAFLACLVFFDGAAAQPTEECYVPNPAPMWWSLVPSSCQLYSSLGQCAYNVYIHPVGASCGYVNALCRSSGRWGWIPSSAVDWSSCKAAAIYEFNTTAPSTDCSKAEEGDKPERGWEDASTPAAIHNNDNEEGDDQFQHKCGSGQVDKPAYQCPSVGNHALAQPASLREKCQYIQINGLNAGDVVRVDSCDGVCCNVWAYRFNQGGYVYCWDFYPPTQGP